MGKRSTTKRRELDATEVQAWFNANTSPVVRDSYDGATFFEGVDSTLSVEVEYEDGCPTCGGAYVRRWILES